MPFMRISVSDQRDPETRDAIATGVHRAMADALGTPEDDRFQLVDVHPLGQRHFDGGYLGIARRDVVLVEITLIHGRTEQQKRDLYRRVCQELVAVGVRSEDVFIVLTENERSGWSIGNGGAQVLDLPRPDLPG
jgi:4-oxalocrotonate tautomerase